MSGNIILDLFAFTLNQDDFMAHKYPTDRMNSNMITSGKNGSQQAFENLYDTYSASLLGMITKVTGIGKMSENVLQQAFLEIWHKKANYDGSKERFFTWMIKIAFNIAILAARKGKEYTSAEIMTIKNLVYGKATEVNQD